MRAGIVIDTFGVSQLSLQMIEELNQLSKLDEYVDIMVFYSTYGPILKPQFFAMLQDQEMWGFDAPVMSTSLDTTKSLLSCPKPTKKFFYVWELEWVNREVNVEEVAKVYCHPDITLVARSAEQAQVITQCWKKPEHILEEFDYEQLVKIFRS